MSFIKYLIYGICIGMANVIPGVSGSTIAVVLGIYDKFVNAITLNLKKLKENWRFVVPMLIGMLSGVLLFSKLIQILYKNFPMQTNYFFTGLILGSIPMLARYFITNEKKEISAENVQNEEAVENQHKEKKFDDIKNTVTIGICIFLGIILILAFGYVDSRFGGEDNSLLNGTLPPFTIPLALKIFLGGILGAVAMIVPGISGSLLMLILGIYPIVITSIPQLFVPSSFFHALILLLPNGVGVIIGLLGGAKLISFFFKKFPTQTYAVIFGLIVGSAILMFPGFTDVKNALHVVLCLVSLVVGFFMSYISSKFSKD